MAAGLLRRSRARGRVAPAPACPCSPPPRAHADTPCAARAGEKRLLRENKKDDAKTASGARPFPPPPPPPPPQPRLHRRRRLRLWPPPPPRRRPPPPPPRPSLLPLPPPLPPSLPPPHRRRRLTPRRPHCRRHRHCAAVDAVCGVRRCTIRFWRGRERVGALFFAFRMAIFLCLAAFSRPAAFVLFRAQSGRLFNAFVSPPWATRCIPVYSFDIYISRCKRCICYMNTTLLTHVLPEQHERRERAESGRPRRDRDRLGRLPAPAASAGGCAVTCTLFETKGWFLDGSTGSWPYVELVGPPGAAEDLNIGGCICRDHGGALAPLSPESVRPRRPNNHRVTSTMG